MGALPRAPNHIIHDFPLLYSLFISHLGTLLCYCAYVNQCTVMGQHVSTVSRFIAQVLGRGISLLGRAEQRGAAPGVHLGARGQNYQRGVQGVGTHTQDWP
jgi:hypothetical protein